MHCIFLDKNKRCLIYPERPNVCKLQGNTKELPCPRIHSNEIIKAKLIDIDKTLEKFDYSTSKG
jgi:Fe-S-cluster containining protein